MKTVHTHILGFPRIGAQRELKFALEAHWRGASTEGQLEAVGRTLRARHWALQRDAGLDLVTVGDFAFYDQVANHIELLGCAPARFGFDALQSPLSRYFQMARGSGAEHAACCGGGAHALEMSKWFDTNYHYLVPEFSRDTAFTVAGTRLFDEVIEARALGHAVKASLIGPLTFLWLGKEKEEGFDRLDLLDALLPAYVAILARLHAAGVEWVQIDEPILGLDLSPRWRNAFEPAYWRLNQAGARLMLATYFSPLEENVSLACRLPVAGLHVDGVRARHELASVNDWLALPKVLSVGVIDGRNVWPADLEGAAALLAPLADKRQGQLWIAPSCSLQHVPFSAAGEALPLAFACEKLGELATLKAMLETGQPAPARTPIAGRANAAVAERIRSLPPDADQRALPHAERQAVQQQRLRLPAFPTTTIGSFPQTAAIRSARAAYRAGRLADDDYASAMRAEIALAIGKQQALGLDVLVHGEAERNDMVEYFGEQLDGFALTRNGWVQSYGSRCVKPPLIVGDVARPKAMTVGWTVHAQSLATQPVKGMLTGPVTILQWSFVRDDQPRSLTALQIALAIGDEVADLQAAGIGIIQIDEPALREGLPLRRGQWAAYLDWATRAFRISAARARADTQIHTHMCYAEFNDILPQIAAMDADVITIETSRSDMELLDAFAGFRYPNQIGPGVYDIHSPAVPTRAQMVGLLKKAAQVIPRERLWVNPDCGLKTRGWPETEAALRNMVEAAKEMRAA